MFARPSWARMLACAVAAGSLVVLSLALSQTAGAAVPNKRPLSATTGGLSAAESGHWVSVRTEFGFRHDQNYLTGLTRYEGDSADIGVPLAHAEHNEMIRRYGLGKYVSEISKAADASPYFGGVRVDQESGGVVVISVVGNSDQAVALGDQSSAIVAAGNPVTVDHVTYAAKAIRDADNEIVADFSAHKLDAYDVDSINEGPQSVIINISSDAPSASEADLAARYPWSFVEVRRVDHGVEFQKS